ncbi:hypothetical protein H4582DRAFT_1992930, partial [Lactarius indigo]
AWNGTSATAHSTPVACANDAEVTEGDKSVRLPRVCIRATDAIGGYPRSTPKACAYNIGVIEYPENQSRTVAARTKTDGSPPSLPLGGNDNTLFAVVTNLNSHLTAIYATLPLMATPITDVGGFHFQDGSDAAAGAGAAGLAPELPTEIPGVGNLAFFKPEDAQYRALCCSSSLGTVTNARCPRLPHAGRTALGEPWDWGRCSDL